MDTRDDLGGGNRGSDLRVFERFSARWPTKFTDSPEDYGTEVEMKNCSASGARLFTNERFLVDDNISIDVKAPDGCPPLQFSGRVCWFKNRGSALWDVGMEFHKVELMKMHRLVKFAHEVELSCA